MKRKLSFPESPMSDAHRCQRCRCLGLPALGPSGPAARMQPCMAGAGQAEREEGVVGFLKGGTMGAAVGHRWSWIGVQPFDLAGLVGLDAKPRDDFSLVAPDIVQQSLRGPGIRPHAKVIAHDPQNHSGVGRTRNDPGRAHRPPTRARAARLVRVVRVALVNPDQQKPLRQLIWSGWSGWSGWFKHISKEDTEKDILRGRAGRVFAPSPRSERILPGPP